jgi:hypothetical protein
MVSLRVAILMICVRSIASAHECASSPYSLSELTDKGFHISTSMNVEEIKLFSYFRLA